MALFSCLWIFCSDSVCYLGYYFVLQWVAKQREQYKLHKKGKHSFLTPDRLEKLTSIGFVWSVRGESATPVKAAATKDESAAEDKPAKEVKKAEATSTAEV